MAKNRKTKKEKLRAATRAVAPSLNSSPTDKPYPDPVFTFVTDTSLSDTRKITTTTATISHLREDLIRTTTVIAAILLAEIALYALLTRI